jgi:23S rRNA (cytosine1962-C5)-methyltransferase
LNLPPLYLKRREERRVRAGHPWIFSNEVDVARSPVSGFEPGAFVNVLSHSGQVLGTAYVNPATLICARMVSRRGDRPLDRALLRERLAHALALRERMGVGPYYRLVFGESDALPGLVVDRYGDTLAVQMATAGMQGLAEPLLGALDALLSPRAVVLRNDGAGRRLEGLEETVEWWRGEDTAQVEVLENGSRFPVSPGSGQKTGWFFDHRLNRARVAAWARGARVLDLFSYCGGFGVQAARAGAASVLCVDSSQDALEGASRAAEMNGVGRQLEAVRGDVFEVLKQLHDDGRRFDLVVADPPAFARRKRDLPAAREAYRRLDRLAMRVLTEDGLLFAASCSSHLSADGLRDAIRGGARAASRRVSFVEQGHQGPDHPVHPALPESAYLKAFLVRVCD